MFKTERVDIDIPDAKVSILLFTYQQRSVCEAESILYNEIRNTDKLAVEQHINVCLIQFCHRHYSLWETETRHDLERFVLIQDDHDRGAFVLIGQWNDGECR